MALSLKKRAFINEYFLCNFNGTEAYKRAYGVTDDNAAAASASRLLRDVKIKQEIETRFAERAMSANEVIDRLSQIARGERCTEANCKSASFATATCPHSSSKRIQLLDYRARYAQEVTAGRGRTHSPT